MTTSLHRRIWRKNLTLWIMMYGIVPSVRRLTFFHMSTTAAATRNVLVAMPERFTLWNGVSSYSLLPTGRDRGWTYVCAVIAVTAMTIISNCPRRCLTTLRQPHSALPSDLLPVEVVDLAEDPSVEDHLAEV